MTPENYVLYLLGTVGNYSSKVKKHLLKSFIEEGVAQAQSQLNIDSLENGVDVADIELEGQVKKCLKESIKAVKLFEKWEFTKDYKYSTLFKTNDFDALYKKASEIESKDDSDACESKVLGDSLVSPIRYEIDDFLILKFNKRLSAIGVMNTVFSNTITMR